MVPVAWKTAGVSIAGFAHEAESSPCQDAHSCAALPGGYLVAAVSDGAGTAARSIEGARYLCELVVTELSLRLAEFGQVDGSPFEETVAKPWIEEVIEVARHHFKTLAKDQGGSISDFHATLVAAIAGPAGGMFFHIGDGAACATCSADFSQSVVSRPENGEYANETYFFTQDEWREHLRLLSFGPQYDLIALMSDGVTPFALARGEAGPSPQVFEPLCQFLTVNSREEGERALAALLQRDALRRVTGDDKTLLWARRVEADDPLHHR